MYPIAANAAAGLTFDTAINAGGGTRTLTPLRALDFESNASANSATPAIGVGVGANAVNIGRRGVAVYRSAVDDHPGSSAVCGSSVNVRARSRAFSAE